METIPEVRDDMNAIIYAFHATCSAILCKKIENKNLINDKANDKAIANAIKPLIAEANKLYYQASAHDQTYMNTMLSSFFPKNKDIIQNIQNTPKPSIYKRLFRSSGHGQIHPLTAKVQNNPLNSKKELSDQAKSIMSQLEPFIIKSKHEETRQLYKIMPQNDYDGQKNRFETVLSTLKVMPEYELTPDIKSLESQIRNGFADIDRLRASLLGGSNAYKITKKLKVISKKGSNMKHKLPTMKNILRNKTKSKKNKI